MFDTVRSVFALVKIYFQSRSILRKAWKLPEEERWKVVHAHSVPWARDLMEATHSRIVYHGLENIPERNDGEQGFLFVGNHQSYLDIPVLLSVADRPLGFVAKSELGRTPLVKDLIKANGSLLMVQQDIRQSIQVIHQTSEHLSRGLNMVIFPEGARSMSPEIADFKKGALRAATQVGADVIPFRIENLFAVLEGNKKFKVTPQQVDVYFGEPIHTSGLSREEVYNLADNVRDIVINLK